MSQVPDRQRGGLGPTERAAWIVGRGLLAIIGLNL